MESIITFITAVGLQSWEVFLEAAPYILLGLLVGGLLKVFMSPAYVAQHLGHGRFLSVVKAALFGIPIPLCSCGVLPAAAALKKQGANNGATTAFLISTPESGVDSISITYALLDPILTVARPIAAFTSAFVAGVTENLVNPPSATPVKTNLSCAIDNCCDGEDCPPDEHVRHHSFTEKIWYGLKYAATDIWADLVGWFFIGIFMAGLITVLVPDELFTTYLGGGLSSMLLMLVFGIPLYICATASTPIAAALIMKGVSPGAALVFLLVGPATNAASLSVLIGLLGKRATAIYLIAISIVAVISGLLLDAVYNSFGINVRAVVGQAAEILPYWLVLASALLLLVFSVRPLWKIVRGWFGSDGTGCGCSSESCETDHHHEPSHDDGCGCGGSCQTDGHMHTTTQQS